MKDICGLNKEEIRRLIGNVGGIQHTIDEEDWDKERLEAMKSSMEELKNACVIMEGYGCRTLPHGLGSLNQEYQNLEKCIDNKNAKCASKAITHIVIGLLDDI